MKYHVQILTTSSLSFFLVGCVAYVRADPLTVTSEPSGAEVVQAYSEYANGGYSYLKNRIGETPLTFLDDKPRRILTISMEGYEPVVDDAPRQGSVHFVLKQIRHISLTITSTPIGASIISASGAKIGIAPFKEEQKGVNVYWPATTVRLEHPGYFPATVSYQKSEADVDQRVTLDPIPQTPRDPAFTYPDPEKVVVTPVMLDSRPDPAFAFKPEHTIAIMRLGDRGQEGAGSLAADTMIIGLQRTGRSVVERDRLEQIAREQGLMVESKVSISDKELAEKLGKLLKADYFMYGAVTEYAAKSEQVSLSPVLEPARAAEYERETKAYLEAYRSHNQAAPITTFKSLDQWTMDYASKTKQSYMTVARVGITSKIIEVSTGKIVWVGIASTSDTSLQSGMRRLVDAVVADITKGGK